MAVIISYPDLAADSGCAPKRRDRHGRGMRGEMIPAILPAFRTRRERFDELVVAAVGALESGLDSAANGVEVAVEDVPPSGPAPWEHGGAPLGRYFPSEAGLPPRITLYRRPIETRTEDRDELAALVMDVAIEQFAHLLGRAPEDIDPRSGR